MKEMNHVVTEISPGELGVGCKCGKRFPTRKAAEGHVADQNLIEQNEAKAKAAASNDTLGPQQIEDVIRHTSPQPDGHQSKPEAPKVSESAKSEKAVVASPAEPEPPAEKMPD
jgi:hypothetical protein